MIRKTENICVFLTGGIVYGTLEMLWRGYTHWSMTLAGGTAFLLIHLINRKFRNHNIFLRCFWGCLLITGVEFLAGMVVNLWMGLEVWNYSAMAFNLMGQICPAFSALWFLLSFPACILSDGIENFFVFLQKREDTIHA